MLFKMNSNFFTGISLDLLKTCTLIEIKAQMISLMELRDSG